MGDLIELPQDDPKFKELLAATLDRLARAADVLEEDLFNAAMVGPWRDFNEEQPTGAVVNLDPRALGETGDDRITQLHALLKAMRHAVRELQPRDESPLPLF